MIVMISLAPTPEVPFARDSISSHRKKRVFKSCFVGVVSVGVGVGVWGGGGRGEIFHFSLVLLKDPYMSDMFPY